MKLRILLYFIIIISFTGFTGCKAASGVPAGNVTEVPSETTDRPPATPVSTGYPYYSSPPSQGITHSLNTENRNGTSDQSLGNKKVLSEKPVNTPVVNHVSEETNRPQPGDWIEPEFEIIRGEIGMYFRIAIKNKEQYKDKQYEMKSECISHPFNEALKYKTDGTLITYSFNTWKPVDSNFYLTYLAKAEYALPENEKKYPIQKGMEITYEISLKKDGFIKKYPITVTVE